MFGSKNAKEYSDKEEKLIAYFEYSSIMENISPVTMYRMMMEKAFIDGMTGPEVEAVRRCNKALRDCTVYRNTRAWDMLIGDMEK